MEIVQIINDGTFGQNQWGEFISLDGGDSDNMFQDVLVAPFEAQPPPQYYVVEGDGSVLTLVDGNNFVLAPEEDDDVPSHKLDHMYAKKPREPGTEAVKPIRRRSKKKELLKNQYLVQEMMYDPPPKINIIRGRHAMNSSGYSRPKILTSPQKNALSSTNIVSSSRMPSVNHFSSFGKNPKVEDTSQALIFEEYDEYNAPSPGAVVTVCDGIEMDPVVVTTRPVKPRKINYHIASGQSPSSIDNRNSSLDSIGDPEDESELFLDFPMGEEVDSTIDVDFSEISTVTTSAMDMIRSAPITFHQGHEPDDSEFSVSEQILGVQSQNLHLGERKAHQSVFGENSLSEINGDVLVRQEDVEDKVVVGALNAVNDDDFVTENDYVNEGDDVVTEDNQSGKQIAQTVMLLSPRRSKRPTKAPSRLEDIEDVSCVKRRRR